MMLEKKQRTEIGIKSAPGYPKMGMQHYLPYLKSLHEKLKPNIYFEIGTESGASLSFAECISIAVDPQFRLDLDIVAKKPQLHLFQGTSDDFFATGMLQKLDYQIDFAFLDGMHLFEYLLRDFINTEKAMSPGGVITMHDCVPFNPLVAERVWDKKKTRSWTGDVWKLIPILHEYRPDLKVVVFDVAPTGLVYVTGLDPENTKLLDHYDEILTRYTALTLEEFGLEEFDEILDLQETVAKKRPRRRALKKSGVIALKTCVADYAGKESREDYHFVRSLAAAFERSGHKTRIDIMPDWGKAPETDSLDIVLQGHDTYPCRPDVPNMLWFISPSKRFDLQSMKEYDHVFFASEIFREKFNNRFSGLNASLLLQAFDSEIMTPVTAPQRQGMILVGNNHFGKKGPPITEFAQAGGYDLEIWGRGWDDAIWQPHLQGNSYPYAKLGGLYGNAEIVLCDHLPKMARTGFLSNRIFYALACGTPVLSGPVSAMPEDFAPFIEIVSTPEEFSKAVKKIQKESKSKQAKRLKLARKMKDKHSFDARARVILEKAAELELIP